MPVPDDLVMLAQTLGDPSHDLCILAEGNVSCSDGATLWVKASGTTMRNCNSEAFVQVNTSPIKAALENPPPGEEEIRRILDNARVDPNTNKRASTETFMHAWLLEQDSVNCVAHSHPTPLLSILSLESAVNYARMRFFPDEIVFCGKAACFVPYAAPGLPLAIEIRESVARYYAHYQLLPKTIWLQNHGLIALGTSIKECVAISLMSVKSAWILLHALSTGKPVRAMPEEDVEQIWNWTDEHFRRAQLA